MALAAVIYGTPPARAASSPGVSATAAYAQQVQRARRPRIEIRSARKLVRECTSWLQQEARPSGTVIVPKMHCWWRPG
jgi:hypothetical protein